MFQPLRKKYLISYDLSQIIFLIVTNLKELNLLQDLDLVWAIYKNINSNIVSRYNKSFMLLWSRYWVLNSFFPQCLFFFNERHTIISTIRSLNSKLLDCTDYDFAQTLLFGNTSQTLSNNFKILNASINYILLSKRFDDPLF